MWDSSVGCPITPCIPLLPLPAGPAEPREPVGWGGMGRSPPVSRVALGAPGSLWNNLPAP